MVLFVTSLILSFFILDIKTQIVQQYTQNACASKTTCHECIETPSCAWCYDTAFNTTKRCFQPAYPLSPLDKCDPAKIYNPDNVLTVIQNATVSTRKSVSGGGGIQVEGWEASMNASEHHEMKGSGSHASGGYEGASGIVQVSPQRLSLQLRAKQTYSISMYYTQAEDYPVDLYYLMDLSKSMEDDKQKLSILGNRLANTMKKMTSKFTLGFGSFVDKVVMPYVSTIPEKLRHPCNDCVAPYGFRNHMTLSTNTNKFSDMVESANVSGNLDAPEGGFDAIMQAVVCRRQIGWREKARRLLVFSTDAGFHYAGDGKLGGIVKPNDGQCHLDARGYYSMSDKQDYPSVSQINTFVKKNAINVIFAVTAEKIEIYKKLQKHIEGSSYGQLSKDSSNVVELIKEQYEAISSTVEMKHNASSAVSVKFFSKCLHPDGEITETNKCGGIKVGSLVEFRVELEVIKCPKKRKDWFQTIQIYPVGINESLTIDLEMLCDCPCEHLGHPSFRMNANECHNKGTFMCGICDCQDGSYGSYCECLKNETTHILNTNCINPDTGLVCSGRGSCICGKCQCEQRLDPSELIYNDTCECDNFSCERYNGLLCGGEKHGRCDCGECKCIEPWIGSDCSCSNSTAECRRFPNDTELCSGHGTCECGVCICNKTEAGEYSGPFCERVPTFDECDNYKDCVYCEMFRKGMSDKKCETCSISPIGVDVLTVDERNFEKLCAFYDEDQCRYSFIYYTERNGSIGIRAKNELECPPEVFLLGIVLGVIAVVVLVGLAILLLWKLVTTLQDRKEFARFEKEAMMARWDTGENPIYKQATSTFKNPTYAGKG